jgi:hypothetical protein
VKTLQKQFETLTENQPNIDWCTQESPNKLLDALWPATSSKVTIRACEPESYVKITSKEASDKGQSESPQEDRGADILSASVSTRKGSRYSRRLANLTLSFTTGSASRGTEKPGQGSDLAQLLLLTIQVHINNGRVEEYTEESVHSAMAYSQGA